MLLNEIQTCFFSLCFFALTFFKSNSITFRFPLTLSWRRPLLYRNQSIDLRSKSLDWFLYVNGLRYERVKDILVGTIIIGVMITKINKDVIFDLNTLSHKLLDSIRLNAQTIMRPPIFVSLFTACPLFISAVLNPLPLSAKNLLCLYKAPCQIGCKLIKILIYYFQ